ncbi:MAG: hypothetical protein ACLP0J_18025 [Solirubrobacteraceae bacterium]
MSASCVSVTARVAYLRWDSGVRAGMAFDCPDAIRAPISPARAPACVVPDIAASRLNCPRPELFLG